MHIAGGEGFFIRFEFRHVPVFSFVTSQDLDFMVMKKHFRFDQMPHSVDYSWDLSLAWAALLILFLFSIFLVIMIVVPSFCLASTLGCQ